MTRPTLKVLVGLPGTGKSTYRARWETENPEGVVISTDDMVEAYAADHGLTYSEAFPLIDMTDFEHRARGLTVAAAQAGRDILIDRTNLRRASRKAFTGCAMGHRKIAVVFSPPRRVHQDWLEARAAATGKIIPEAVIETMRAGFEPPTADEISGEYDEVLVMDHLTGRVTAMERFW